MTYFYVRPNLTGGLGNQMFQCACALAISLDQKKTLTIPPHAKVHQTVDYSEVLKWRQEQLNIPYHVMKEAPHQYSTLLIIPNVDGNIILLGYFQNEKYFLHRRSEILNAFKMKDETRLFLTQKYNPSGSMFIHVRRGDYCTNQKHFIDFTLYYERAISYVLDKLGKNTHFYIFSDDIEYCKSFKPFYNINKTFVEGLDEVQSLYLMSLCRLGGVCANSTYSWWGAWLNENEDKLVIFPDKWLNSDWNCDIYTKKCIIIPHK